MESEYGFGPVGEEHEVIGDFYQQSDLESEVRALYSENLPARGDKEWTRKKLKERDETAKQYSSVVRFIKFDAN